VGKDGRSRSGEDFKKRVTAQYAVGISTIDVAAPQLWSLCHGHGTFRGTMAIALFFYPSAETFYFNNAF